MTEHGSGVASARGRAAHTFFLEAQEKIAETLGSLDGRAGFRTDDWTRAEGGGGRTRVISEGALFEKGGVNVSCVFGELSEAFARELPGPGRRFFATGISLVIHPRSPHVPTVHANFRYLEKGDASATEAWFGGGADLTPWILYDEDAIHFHRTWRDVCARHAEVADYRGMKKQCDDYFLIAHRGERRGVGGIFFDYLKRDLDRVFDFVKDGAGSFLDAYCPIVEARKDLAYSEDERDWQLARRGRYVEFNLVYDRGTIFGLKTNGRVESILMSLPSLVRFPYDEAPRAGTYQERLIEVLRSPRDWLGLG